jgi:hypothetical protein
MPYFQRGSVGRVPLPSQDGTQAAARIAATFVDKATKIIDEATSGASLAGSRAPKSANVPLVDLPEIASLQKRASDALAALLDLFANAMPPALTDQVTAPGAQISSFANTVPILEPTKPVKAGETATIALSLPDDARGSEGLVLYSSDFIADTGFAIPSTMVTFSPRVVGRAVGKSAMTISVPAQCAPGMYSALVQATGLGRPYAVVVLKLA